MPAESASRSANHVAKVRFSTLDPSAAQTWVRHPLPRLDAGFRARLTRCVLDRSSNRLPTSAPIRRPVLFDTQAKKGGKFVIHGIGQADVRTHGTAQHGGRDVPRGSQMELREAIHFTPVAGKTFAGSHLADDATLASALANHLARLGPSQRTLVQRIIDESATGEGRVR